MGAHLHPFRHINPGVGGGIIVNVNSKNISLTVFFASAYAVGVILFAPVSFDPRFQIRIADALLPLSIVFGPPAALGLGLGCSISGLFGGYGVIDIIFGGIANFVACMLAWLIGGRSIKRRFLGCLTETIVITVIVGGYLSHIVGIPVEISLFGLLVGSLISINILGFMLLEALYRRGMGKIVKNLQ
ncbi:MAG: QueT transporter family protein [Candidatus Bathyarchaeia archaeon]